MPEWWNGASFKQHQTFKIHSRATTVIQQPLNRNIQLSINFTKGSQLLFNSPPFLHPTQTRINKRSSFESLQIEGVPHDFRAHKTFDNRQ